MEKEIYKMPKEIWRTFKLKGKILLILNLIQVKNIKLDSDLYEYEVYRHGKLSFNQVVYKD